MSEIDELFPDQRIGLREVRHALHVEFDLALDALLLDILHRPITEDYETIAIQVSQVLLKHAQEQMP